jgi:hypothetical protein
VLHLYQHWGQAVFFLFLFLFLARDSRTLPSCYPPVRHSPTVNDWSIQPLTTPRCCLLRRRPLFPHDHPAPVDFDDTNIFLQLPFKSPPLRYYSNLAMLVQIPKDDNGGGVFLSSSAAHPSSFSQLPALPSQPLWTPVKQIHHAPSHSYLPINPQTLTFSGGTKCKSTPLDGSGIGLCQCFMCLNGIV